jgi:hypothetical protein
MNEAEKLAFCIIALRAIADPVAFGKQLARPARLDSGNLLPLKDIGRIANNAHALRGMAKDALNALAGEDDCG